MRNDSLKWKSIGDVAEVVTGSTPKKSNPNFYGGNIPWIKPGDVQNRLAPIKKTEETLSDLGAMQARILPPKAVLVTCIGEIGRVGITAGPSATNQQINAVIFKDEVVPEFGLYSILYSKQNLEKASTATTVPILNKSNLQKVQIPILSKEKQLELANKMQHLETARNQRAISLKLLDSFLSSLFIEMFGDPTTNPKKWPVKRIEQLIYGIELGKNVNPSENDDPKGLRVLKVSSVTWGLFDWTESKPLPPSYRPSNESHYVKKNDFLFSRANTTELVGAVAIVREVPKNMLLPDKLWRIKWMDSNINQEFALHLLRNPGVRDQLSKFSSCSSGSMKNITQRKFVTLEVPQPPLDLQSKFAESALLVERLRTSLLKSERDLKRLFESLISEYFRAIKKD